VAPADSATAAISSTLPLPTSVAGSGLGLRCTTSRRFRPPRRQPAHETPRKPAAIGSRSRDIPYPPSRRSRIAFAGFAGQAWRLPVQVQRSAVAPAAGKRTRPRREALDPPERPCFSGEPHSRRHCLSCHHAGEAQHAPRPQAMRTEPRHHASADVATSIPRSGRLLAFRHRAVGAHR
jgi:hypothetical protein